MTAELDTIEGINNVLGVDRTKLRDQDSDELILKFDAKLQALKERFIVNLPFNKQESKTGSSNNYEFSSLINKLKSLKKNLNGIKSDETNLRELLDEYKSRNKNSELKTYFEDELKPILLKSICIKRQLCYMKCLTKLEEFSVKIESHIITVKDLEEKKVNLIKSLSENKKSNQETSINQSIKIVQIELEQSIEKLVELFSNFIDYCEQIKETNCSNLKSYLTDLLLHFGDQVKLILKNNFNNFLTLLSFPILSPQLTQNLSIKQPIESSSKSANENESNQQSNSDQKEHNEKQLKIFAQRLLKLDYKINIFLSKPYQTANILIELLVEPLEKRFKFHFFGNRKTNNLEKPEWYLNQILNWIKDHDKFLIRNIQPVFDNLKHLPDKSAILEFSNALLKLVREKINFDLNSLVKNQKQFSHTIDELISFDNQLKSYLKTIIDVKQLEKNKPTIYTCLHIICENDLIFSQWLNLERQICLKKVDLIFTGLNTKSTISAIASLNDLLMSEDSTNKKQASLFDEQTSEIWACNYSDVDSMKPPSCAESFVLMIKAITDRYANLPYPSRKLRFSYLQIELLKDFHLRLCQIIRDESKTPFSKNYLGVLNTINYIIYILDEWKNSPFYIEIQFLKIKYQQFEKKCEIKSNDENDPEINDQLALLFDNQIMSSDMNSLSYSYNSLLDIDSTLFDEVLSSYEKIKDDMINTIVFNCRWEITSRSKFYKKEKWMAMPLFTEYYKPTLTQSAADMLISLRNLLHLLKESVAKSLFETILKKIIYELDKFFYEDIISQSNFNEGGIMQLDFDITKYLLPILNEFAFEIKIDSYFKTSKESIALLKLKQGSAILLKDILNKALHDYDDLNNVDPNDDKNLIIFNAKNALKEFGIIQLSCKQARDVLNLRSDFIQ